MCGLCRHTMIDWSTCQGSPQHHPISIDSTNGHFHTAKWSQKKGEIVQTFNTCIMSCVAPVGPGQGVLSLAVLTGAFLSVARHVSTHLHFQCFLYKLLQISEDHEVLQLLVLMSIATYCNMTIYIYIYIHNYMTIFHSNHSIRTIFLIFHDSYEITWFSPGLVQVWSPTQVPRCPGAQVPRCPDAGLSEETCETTTAAWHWAKAGCSRFMSICSREDSIDSISPNMHFDPCKNITLIYPTSLSGEWRQTHIFVSRNLG